MYKEVSLGKRANIPLIRKNSSNSESDFNDDELETFYYNNMNA